MQPDLFMIFGLRLRLRQRLKYEFRVACFVVYENYKARGCPLPNGSPISLLCPPSLSLSQTCPKRWQQFSVSRCFMSALKCCLLIGAQQLSGSAIYMRYIYTHTHIHIHALSVCVALSCRSARDS